MLSNDPFMSVFGASKSDGSGLDYAPQIAAFAVKQGFAVVVIEPGGKKPLCTLTSRQVNQADAYAREQAAASGDRHAERRRHQCGIYHALTDPAKAMATVRRLIKTHGVVNLGVELGRSKMIVVDVDTEEEKAAFVHDLKRLGTGESSTLEPTVLSPGKRNAAGEWTHRGGGHYWFRPPEGWEGGGQGVHKVTNEVGSYTILWADRQVLVPPSVRAEGPYRITAPPLPLPAWLLGKIGGSILAHEERQERTFQRLTGGDASSIDVWSAGRPWDEMMLPDGWTPTGLLDHCSCPTWTRPGDWSNPKSATAHEPGCTRYDTDMGSGPLHVWTDSPPEYLADAARTMTKVQYLAWRYHGGNIGATLAELGISQDGGPAMDLTFTGTAVPIDAPERAASLPVAKLQAVVEDECPFLAAEAPAVTDSFTDPGASDEEIEEEAARIEEEEAAGADDPLDQPAPGAVEELIHYDVNDLDAIPLPSPLIKGVIDVDTVAILSGKFGTYKSFVAMSWGASLATGQDWCGHDVPEAVPVIYVAAEGAAGIRRRMAAWSAVHGSIPRGKFIVVPMRVSLADVPSLRKLAALIKKYGAKLVVLDTLHKMAPGMEETSKDAGEALAMVDKVRQLAPSTFLLVHHTGHAGKRARGSSSIEDDVDTSWVIELGGDGEARKAENPRTLVHRKSKEEELSDDMNLQFVAVDGTGSGHVEASSDPFDSPSGGPQAASPGRPQTKTEDMLHLVDLLTETGGGCTKTDMVNKGENLDAVEGRGAGRRKYPVSSMRRQWDSAVEDGTLAPVIDPHGKTTYRRA